MLLKRFYDTNLAQASYLVGCAATGEALVVDPNRDIAQYLRAAEAEGLRITHITETHIHADFVSGARELAARTGATLYLSDEGDADWKYGYAADADAVLLKDRDTFMVGNIRIEALHTPGHTPEHLSFLVTDTPATDRPMGVFTGDFVFVGDVGRPDLLEKAAKVVGTMEAGARTLYRSLQRFKQLPDYLQLWPGHGAGSACGKSLGAVPQTTLGYERIANWGLEDMTEDQFVERVLAGQPEPPRYFAEMKRINKVGPRVLGALERPAPLPAGAIVRLADEGVLVVDTRAADAFAAAHVPGTINIPLNKSFTTWAGWLVPYDRDVVLLVEDEGRLDEAVQDLAMIGLDRVSGYLRPDGLAAWTAAGRALLTTPQITVEELAPRLATGGVDVRDVRGASEWESGHLPGVPNIPLGYLEERLAELPTGRPLVVHCQSGARSAIAASVLQARGVREVVNLVGGFAAWARAGEPVERGAPAGVGG
ncbi:MAG TPA: MBL fold metallo-hydrolase [Gemmatimonadales bacterium]|nr:MBL fold metallo-hydrolase [Gemmatimonadales bacterium]